MNIAVRDHLGDEWTVCHMGRYERNEHELVTYRAVMLNHSTGIVWNNVRLPIWTVWFTHATIH